MRSRASWVSGVLVAALLAGCSDSPRDFRFEFNALGTIVTVSLYSTTTEQAERALSELQSDYARLGIDWYPWSPGELRRLNQSIERGECLKVSEELMGLLWVGAAMEMKSGGRFNAGLGRLSELWGLQPAPKTLTALPEREQLHELVSSSPSVAKLDIGLHEVCSLNPNTMVDPGGFAKGAILNASRAILELQQIQNGIVNLGGDLLVLGNVNGRDARIGIRSPIETEPIAGLDVRTGEAVMTSGNYERFVEINGKRYTHIFDPRTGYPVEHTASVTVVDKDPILADAAATALLVGGPDEFDEIVAAMDLTYALLIDTQGDMRLTPAMAERLHWTEPRDKQ